MVLSDVFSKVSSNSYSCHSAPWSTLLLAFEFKRSPELCRIECACRSAAVSLTRACWLSLRQLPHLCPGWCTFLNPLRITHDHFFKHDLGNRIRGWSCMVRKRSTRGLRARGACRCSRA